jgi:ATPase subunit of ABC transporter with duplicated ATPase domains
LEDALNDYDGTIITVSHDRYFLDRIATQILFFAPDGVEDFDGGYTEFYEAHHRAKQQEAEAARVAAEAQRKAETASKQISQPAKKKKPKGPTAFEIETQIHATETQISELSALLATEDVARDKARLFALSEQYTQLEETLQELYQQWEEALSQSE